MRFTTRSAIKNPPLPALRPDPEYFAKPSHELAGLDTHTANALHRHGLRSRAQIAEAVASGAIRYVPRIGAAKRACVVRWLDENRPNA